MQHEVERIIEDYFADALVHGDFVTLDDVENCASEIITAFLNNLPTPVNVNEKYETDDDGGVTIDTDCDNDLKFMCKFSEDKGRNETLDEIKKSVYDRP